MTHDERLREANKANRLAYPQAKKYVEEGDFLVTVTLTNTITFSPIERDGPLTGQDAIENAKGTLPDDFFEKAEGECWNVEFEVERLL